MSTRSNCDWCGNANPAYDLTIAIKRVFPQLNYHADLCDNCMREALRALRTRSDNHASTLNATTQLPEGLAAYHPDSLYGWWQRLKSWCR